jgi:hypothetical protein
MLTLRNKNKRKVTKMKKENCECIIVNDILLVALVNCPDHYLLAFEDVK